MSIYTGPGFRCRESVACALRIYPSSGTDADVDEAARLRAQHERTCRKASLVAVPPRVADDRAGQIAAAMVELTDPPRAGTFRVTCKVCGDKFVATGPRAQFCSKASCQAQRAVPV